LYGFYGAAAIRGSSVELQIRSVVTFCSKLQATIMGSLMPPKIWL